MPDKTTTERFHELLTRLLEDELDESEIREFTKLVKSNPDFSDELRAQLLMDSRLAQYENESQAAESFNTAIEAALDAGEDGDAFVDKVVSFVDISEAVNTGSKVPWIIAATSIAACIVFAFIALSGHKEPANEEMTPAVAIVQNLVGRLESEEGALSKGDSLKPGIVKIDGYVALEFFKGARMTIAGPARLELVNPQRVICHFGKIRATVPALAKGFTVVTAQSEIVDLGTEFAMEVGVSGKTEVHVFDGEVEAYDAKRNPESMKLLTAGHALNIVGEKNWQPIPMKPDRFEDLVNVNQLARDQDAEKLNAWKAVNRAIKSDSRLIAYYDFERDPERPRTLLNRAAETGSKHNGAIVGARWTNGPWPGKGALSFKHPGDRVRLNLTGEYDDITLAARVRVDGLDRSYSSLLLSDGYEPGDIHWQIRSNGSLSLGLNYSESRKRTIKLAGFMDLSRLGRWFHIATVIDQSKRKVFQYLDGKLLSEHHIKDGGKWTFGDASIGNWDHPIATPSTVRSLNGAMAELMIFRAAISAEEIKRFSLN